MLNTSKLNELMQDKNIKNFKILSTKTKIPYNTLMYMLSGHDMHVSTLMELSKFFNVPIDYLINKSYGIETVNEKSIKFLNNSSLLEVTLLEMM